MKRKTQLANANVTGREKRRVNGVNEQQTSVTQGSRPGTSQKMARRSNANPMRYPEPRTFLPPEPDQCGCKRVSTGQQI